MNERPIFPFLVGSYRSGTTLMRLMLDSHPDIAIPHESYFIPQLWEHRLNRDAAGGPWVDGFLDELLSHRWFRRWELPEPAVRGALAEAAPTTYADAVRAVYAAYAVSRGKSRYGDKTPKYVIKMPLLARLFPEARFVHIIRDGRDVALSLLDVSFGPRTVEGAALLWRRMVMQGRRDGRRLDGRYVEVRYEDLVAEPRPSMQRVCAFLDLPYDEAVLRYFERRDLHREIKNPQHHRHIREPPTPGLRDWRTAMTPRDVAAFESIAGSLLERLGYPRAAKGLSLARRADGAYRRTLDASRRRLSPRRGSKAPAWRSPGPAPGAASGVATPVPRSSGSNG